MRCRVRCSIIEDEPRDVELLWKRKLSDLLREGRRAEVFCFECAVPVLGDASDLHIFPNRLLDLLVKPFLQVALTLLLLALLLRFFMQVAAAGAFIIDPVTPLVVEDVPQILLGRRRSLAVPERWTRSLALSGRRTQSPPSLPKLLSKLTDELILFLDNKVLGPDILQERVIVVVEVGLMMRLRLGQC